MVTTTSNPFPTSDDPPLGSSTSSSMGSAASGIDNGRGYTSSGETIDKVTRTAHDTVDRIAAKAGPTVEKLKSRMGGMSDSMHERGEQLSAMQEEWLEECRSTVREHPIATIAVSVVAGMVLAKMLSSSR